MKKKNRFLFWKTSLWVIGVTAFFMAIMLIMVYYVKLSGQKINDVSHIFNTPAYMLQTAASTIFLCLFFYISLNSYYRIISRHAPWQRYALNSLLMILICFFYYLFKDQVLKMEAKLPWNNGLRIFAYSVATFFNIVISVVIAAITYQLDEKRGQAENQKLLEQRTFRLEKEKMQADFLFLKAQINPHFLHNTLNFLYARSLPYSPELSEGILALSAIMRYSLDNREDGDGKVLLTDEISHVHNVLRIQQLRFDNSLQVRVALTGDPEGKRILPFILITLVENAFKHGDLKSIDNPVNIALTVCPDGQLRFVCSNKKKTGPKELSTGIGLDNTRKRLELAYGENYSLYIKDQRELFTVDLTIKL